MQKKRHFRKASLLLVITLLVVAHAYSDDSIIYWQVGERSWTGTHSAVVCVGSDTYMIADFISNNTIYGTQDDDINAGIDYGVSIKAIDANGSTVYLDTPLGFGEQYGYGLYEDFGWSGPKNMMPISDSGSGAYETGFIQSRIKSDEYNYDIQSGQGWKFAVELGRAVWNEDFSDFEWTVLAETVGFDADAIIAANVSTWSIAPPVPPWEPNVFYATPEPSPKLLLLLGIGILALRKKK